MAGLEDTVSQGKASTPARNRFLIRTHKEERKTAQKDGQKDTQDNGQETDAESLPPIMITALERFNGESGRATYTIDREEAARRLTLTRRFTEWLCSWDEEIDRLLPECWDAHPMIYRIMESLRTSYYGHVAMGSPAGESTWMLQCLWPLTDRLRLLTRGKDLSEPHGHDPDRHRAMYAEMRQAWYREHPAKKGEQPDSYFWAWPPSGAKADNATADSPAAAPTA